MNEHILFEKYPVTRNNKKWRKKEINEATFVKRERKRDNAKLEEMGIDLHKKSIYVTANL